MSALDFDDVDGLDEYDDEEDYEVAGVPEPRPAAAPARQHESSRSVQQPHRPMAKVPGNLPGNLKVVIGAASVAVALLGVGIGVLMRSRNRQQKASARRSKQAAKRAPAKPSRARTRPAAQPERKPAETTPAPAQAAAPKKAKAANGLPALNKAKKPAPRAEKPAPAAAPPAPAPKPEAAKPASQTISQQPTTPTATNSRTAAAPALAPKPAAAKPAGQTTSQQPIATASGPAATPAPAATPRAVSGLTATAKPFTPAGVNGLAGAARPEAERSADPGAARGQAAARPPPPSAPEPKAAPAPAPISAPKQPPACEKLASGEVKQGSGTPRAAGAAQQSEAPETGGSGLVEAGKEQVVQAAAPVAKTATNNDAAEAKAGPSEASAAASEVAAKAIAAVVAQSTDAAPKDASAGKATEEGASAAAPAPAPGPSPAAAADAPRAEAASEEAEVEAGAIEHTSAAASVADAQTPVPSNGAAPREAAAPAAASPSEEAEVSGRGLQVTTSGNASAASDGAPGSPEKPKALQTLKLNADAPAFRPASSPKKAATPKSDGAGGSSSGAGSGALDAVVADKAADKAEPPACAEDDVAEFVHVPLELAGRDIPPDAPPTADETTADEQLVVLARRLQQAGRMSQAEMMRRSTSDLLADVEYCRTHQCRPAKYAEHASTAADFFFQVAAYDAAEDILDGAIQAARMAGAEKLEATLINNLGTVLRKRAKFQRAIALHRKQLADVEEAAGLDSPYIILARNNLVEVLSLMQRVPEARAVLDEQVTKFAAFVTRVKDGERAGVAIPAAAGAEAEGTAHEADPVRAATSAAARCHLDYARFLGAQEQYDEAICYARSALEMSAEAHGDDAVSSTMFISFLGGLLKTKAEQLDDPAASPDLAEAKLHYARLTEVIEALDAASRNLPAIYRTLAQITMQLGQHDEAYAYGRKTIHVMAVLMGGNQHHPSLQPTWRFIEQLHREGGDGPGADAARKNALKCRATLVRSRDASHKLKKQGSAKKAARR